MLNTFTRQLNHEVMVERRAGCKMAVYYLKCDKESRLLRSNREIAFCEVVLYKYLYMYTYTRSTYRVFQIAGGAADIAVPQYVQNEPR